MHYGTYEIGDIVAALSQRSGMTLLLKKSYLGEKEVSECPKDDAKTALEVAKEKAHGQATNRSTNTANPNCHWGWRSEGHKRI